MSKVIGTLLARLWGNSDALAPVSKKHTFRPAVENLEERAVPAAVAAPTTGSISGHVFVDTTGNGAASLGGGEKGVRVYLVRDANGNGQLDLRDRLVDVDNTDAKGAFGFKNLAAGTYFVRELTPRNEVRTAPAVEAGYTVNLAKGQNVTGQDFGNFNLLNRRAVNKITFTVTDAKGVTRTVADLKGNTHAGDTVTANFRVANGSGQVSLSLVAYTTSGPAKGFAGPATDPVMSQVTTATFSPGQHALSITLPNDFYQVDFVVGAPIAQLTQAPSNLNYQAQDRLLSQDNGGQAPIPAAPATLSGTVFQDDGDGVFGPNDHGLDSATVSLVGTDYKGQSVNVSVQTDGLGQYSFANVAPGTYTVSVGTFGFINGPSAVPADEITQTQAQPNTGAIDTVHIQSGAVLTGFDFLEMLSVMGPGS